MSKTHHSTPISKSKPFAYSQENNNNNSRIGQPNYGIINCLNSIQLFNEIYKKAYFNPTGHDLETNIHVKLESRNLWNHFASIGTEMIITKCGRLVFC